MAVAGHIDLELMREKLVRVCLESRRFNLRFMSRERERREREGGDSCLLYTSPSPRD